MAKSFDYTWYHGRMGRENAEKCLDGKRPGLFLVRDSNTCHGDFVLSVSENNKVSHYIINRHKDKYKIGEMFFPNLDSVIDFYSKHFLDSTTLTEPCQKKREEEIIKARGKYNFPGNDTEDLPFKKGDILTIIKKAEPEWWVAKDSFGREGMVPVPYIEVVDSKTTIPAGTPQSHSTQSATQSNGRHSLTSSRLSARDYALPNTGELTRDFSKLMPFYTEAVKDRDPSIYDQYQLKFKTGDRVKVLRDCDNGTWEGMLEDGSRGYFPFTHVDSSLVIPCNQSNCNGAMD